MVGGLENLMAPWLLPVASMALTTRFDASSSTSPKTTCLPSSQLVSTVVMKNWEPLLSPSVSTERQVAVESSSYVFGPALAMDRR